jgi:KDO2-lipid IV(A) lauroyltransferase
MSADAATGSRATRAGERGTLGQRAVTALVAGASVLAARLPEAPLHRLAALAGTGLYLAQSRRRALARDNLRIVCRHLAAEGLGGGRVSAAARDEAALERLVRAAFQHYSRTYLELAIGPVRAARRLEERVTMETPELVEEAFARLEEGHGLLFLGLHMGAMELPAQYALHRVGRPVMVPMETIDNPPLQAHLARQRSGPGVQLVPLEGAGQTLRAWLRRGGVAAVIADRDVLDTGRPVRFFGRPARLPVGGALLAAGTRAAVYSICVRRTGDARYAARLIRLERPVEGSFREQVEELLAAQARAYERLVADAPEQWWAVFFPIWPEVGDGR